MLQSAGRVLSLSVEGVSLASGSTNVASTSVAESEHTKTVRVILGSYLVVCGSPWAHAGKRPTAELIWLFALKLTIPRTGWPAFQLILTSTVRVCRCALWLFLENALPETSAFALEGTMPVFRHGVQGPVDDGWA